MNIEFFRFSNKIAIQRCQNEQKSANEAQISGACKLCLQNECSNAHLDKWE